MAREKNKKEKGFSVKEITTTNENDDSNKKNPSATKQR